MSVIEFSNVSKRFLLRRERPAGVRERLQSALRGQVEGETFWALRDISFSVGKGESLGLVGHNGAGKSTLLKLMTRILEPTSGKVRLHGRVAALLELGSGFHPDLSGRDNVYLYGSLMGFDQRAMDAKLDEIVDFAGIDAFIDTPVKHYSSGMYTRLAFSVATNVDPEILITDEVLAVGDEAFQRKCMDRIYDFRRRGKTIIFVSHALETVRALCDTAVWLDHGEQRAFGPAGEVVDAYLVDVNRQERAELAERGEQQLTEESDRRGTGEIEIVRVELLDGEGTPAAVHRTYEPLTVRMHYVAHQPIDGPVFGLGLYAENGAWVSGPNTSFAGLRLPWVSGPGFVDYRIERLPLLGGRYTLTTAVVDSTMLHTFDMHDRRYKLVVQSDHIPERFGMLALDGRWRLEDA